MPIKLASKMCKTCIFRPELGFNLEEFRKRWGEHGHQTCHQFLVKGERRFTKKHGDRDIWCRGFYEYEISATEKTVLNDLSLVEIVEQKPCRKQSKS